MNTEQPTENILRIIKNAILNDLLIGMVNMPFLICLFVFCLKELKLKL